MNKLKSILPWVGAASIWAITAPAAKAHWASYAYSASRDYGFVSYQHLTRAEAEQAALQGCNTGMATPVNAANSVTPASSDCRILVTGSRWIAVAETTNQLFWFQDLGQKLVEDGVMRLCRRRQDVEPSQPCNLRMLAHASGGILRSLYRPKEILPPEVLNPPPTYLKPTQTKPVPLQTPAQTQPGVSQPSPASNPK